MGGSPELRGFNTSLDNIAKPCLKNLKEPTIKAQGNSGGGKNILHFHSGMYTTACTCQNTKLNPKRGKFYCI
jgi:hypothetical protein